MHGVILLAPNSDPTICVRQQKDSLEIHETRLHFSSLQVSSFGDPVPTGASAFWSWLTEEEPVRFLLTIVQNGHPSYRSLSVRLNQSGHSPLTTFINKAMLAAELPFTGFDLEFLFFRTTLSQF